MRARCVFWEIIMEEKNKNMDNKKSIQDKLATLKYNCDIKEHLKVDQEKCKNCKNKTCAFICPANVYSIDEETQKTIVQWENCLECGACKIACPKKAIEWNYPSAGCGIIYKNS